MIVRKAEPNEFQAVREFYHDIIDGMVDSLHGPGWEKDIYPASDYLSDSIRDGELFIVVEDETIVGSMVLNHQCNGEYRKCQWPTKADDAEVTVIHVLGVHPAHTGKGYAKQMVRFAIDHARKNRQKSDSPRCAKG